MKELFKNLGAGEKEAETFLKLLELGAQPASVVARMVGVPRSTMYLILENLKKLGLVEEFSRAGMKYFKCVSVDSIRDVLKVKEGEIKYAYDLLDEKLPQLKSLENKLSITPTVKFYEGKEAVAKVYEEALKEKTFRAYFNPVLVKKMMPVYLKKVAEVIKENKCEAKEFVVYSKEGSEYKKAYNSSFHQIKILPKTMKFYSDTIICHDKIFMISYGEKDVSAVEIINSSLAETQRVMFEEMWRSM